MMLSPFLIYLFVRNKILCVSSYHPKTVTNTIVPIGAFFKATPPTTIEFPAARLIVIVFRLVGIGSTDVTIVFPTVEVVVDATAVTATP